MNKKKLIQDEYVVLLPENHHLVGSPFIQIQEIADEPFIMPLAGCTEFVNRAFEQIKAKPNVLFEVEHSNTTFHPPGVFTCSLEPKLFRKIGLGVRSVQAAAPAAKAFITTATKWVENNGHSLPV